MRLTKSVSLAVLPFGLLVAFPAAAQTAKPSKSDEIVVEGRQSAEAVCEMVGEGGIYFARGITRAPRDLELGKAPLVPVGSPTPNIVKDQTYTRGPRLARWHDASSPQLGEPDSDGMALRTPTPYSEAGPRPGFPVSVRRQAGSRGDARERCLTALIAGSNAIPQLPSQALLAGDDRNNPKIPVVAMDKSLPLALALFAQRRYAEALPWFLKASSVGYGRNEADLFIAKIYLEGLGDKSDPVKAIKWLKKVATAAFNPHTETPDFKPDRPERNTPIGEASVILGNIYSRGLFGIAQQPAEAYRWYKRAFDVGHIPAAKILGDMHLNGFGVSRDPRKAVVWYEKAAQNGLAAAQKVLADGVPGVPADHRTTLRWYQAAAMSGDPAALFALAQAYDFGDGVKPDPEMALGLYKTAALGGSVPAMTAIGIYFHEGRIVERSEVTARAWFERAAAERDVEAMFNLAAMMANGQGGERDLASAWLWLKEAGAGGHAKAPVALAALERQMSPAERAAVARKTP